MRGEHPISLDDASVEEGSSPHARGAPPGRMSNGWNGRIIPACAGSTVEDPYTGEFVRDHPRMRGEHMLVARLDEEVSESSPHARGAHSRLESPSREAGIIPACAGSTITVGLAYNADRDHPRMRGEHDRVWLSKMYLTGSSPHARGAPKKKKASEFPSGIIPACAGSTLSVFADDDDAGDHPRMRGEHHVNGGHDPSRVGSSPHARGALRRFHCRVRHRWIIPACAGSTNEEPRKPPFPTDHPRMRGEHVRCEG